MRFGQQGTLAHIWAEVGTRPEAVKQTAYESVHLFGAVEPMSGRRAALVSPWVNTAAMQTFLDQVSQQVPAEAHAVVTLDGAGWHMTDHLVVPANLTLHFLPPYSPKLNPVERLWTWLRSHYLANRMYEDYNALVDAACDAWMTLTSERIQSVCTPPVVLGQ